jgi:hypothetical protein
VMWPPGGRPLPYGEWINAPSFRFGLALAREYQFWGV